MSFKIEDGKLTLTVMYKATQPNEVAFASQSASIMVGLEFPVSGDTSEMLTKVEAFEMEMQAHCVFGVATALGLDASVGDDGAAKLEFKEVKAAVIQMSGGGGGGGGGGFKGGGKKPNAPQILVDFGDGKTSYYDFRGAKAKGEYAENRPDFVAVEDDKDALWLMDRSGKEKRYMKVALANAEPAPGDTSSDPF